MTFQNRKNTTVQNLPAKFAQQLLFFAFVAVIFFANSSFAQDSKKAIVPQFIRLEGIQQSIEDKLSKQLEMPVKVDFLKFSRVGNSKIFTLEQVLKSGIDDQFIISSLSVVKLERKFTATLTPEADAYQLKLDGSFSSSVKMPTLSRDFKLGQVISESDIEYKFFPETQVQSSYISKIENLIGSTAIVPIAAGELIRNSAVKFPILVKKGDQVEVEYKVKNLSIKVSASALDNGSAGDSIRFINSESKKTFTGKVLADGTVIAGY